MLDTAGAREDERHPESHTTTCDRAAKSLVRLRWGLTKLRQRTTDRSGSFDVTSGPERPAGFQRQDGIGRRLLGKGRRVRRVIPAWCGQRTATNQKGRRPSWTAWGALSPRANVAVQRKTNICICCFSSARNRPLAVSAPLLACRSPANWRHSRATRKYPESSHLPAAVKPRWRAYLLDLYAFNRLADPAHAVTRSPCPRATAVPAGW